MGNNGGGEAAGAVFAGMMCVVQLVQLALAILTLAGMWKVFVKAGKPGWAAIIQIYNLIVLVEIIGKPMTWVIFLLIPCVGIVFGILACMELAKKFGKDPIYGVGLVLLGFVFWPMLGFGSAQYQGGGAAPQQ